MISSGEGIAIGSVVIAFFGLVFRMNGTADGKRKNIYDRIEQERKDAEIKFQSANMCTERYGNLESKVDEIKCDVKKLLTRNNLK